MSEQAQAGRHWRLEPESGAGAEGILALILDKAGSGTNTLSGEVLEELDTFLGRIEAAAPRAVILRSGKASGFIAGADIEEFTRLPDLAAGLALVERGQRVLARLEHLPCVTVAEIAGFCLGGGLELALACRARVTLDDPKTRLGFPEVNLGIHPGFGGSVRSLRLLGPLKAMDLMLTGRTLDARRAGKLGLVDVAVPARHLKAAALQLAAAPPPRQGPGWLAALASLAFVRPQVAKFLRRQVAKHARPEHYPAPYALIDYWEREADSGDAMYAAEARSVAHLSTTPTARELVRVFFLQERLKGLGKAQDKGLSLGKGEGEGADAAGGPVAAAEFQHCHVVGAGVMGGDIAAWCALRGLAVTMQDREPRFLAPAFKRAHKLFAERIRDPYLRQQALDRLAPDVAGRGVSKADVIIEAIVEKAEAKIALFQSVEPKRKPGALLVTNTSSIPLEVLAKELRNGPGLVGLHFFNPVAKMQLVEIIGGEGTAPEALARASAFARRIDKLPLPVKSSPGFLVNRILTPYLLEAVFLVGEGVPLEAVDEAARAFGMPMGPIELADTVGLDICLSVGEVLAKTLANRVGAEIPAALREKVQAGTLGKKTGKGFYAWDKSGHPVRNRHGAAHWAETYPDLQDRLILTLVNESVACLREQVVADADLLDAGMIFGTGFAPFRGGPIHYLRQRGVEPVRERLAELVTRFGPRYTPDPGFEQGAV
jgi:3-hydroxyacyl-CoA dehydrogenase/enoyl-CoA hydratase/3-hydroxybutyryl-CoA epimerase